MPRHFVYFEKRTDLATLLADPVWQQATIERTINYQDSLMLCVQFTTPTMFDADGQEDFRDLPNYCTALFNV
jgi:hypothetical protein